jgi:hypothetical protein
MRAAVERAVRFDAVTDDLAPTVVAHRRELVNRALEAVERVGRSVANDVERKVIFVTADFAFGHEDGDPALPPLFRSIVD